MKYRVKATNEIVELRTWRRDDGAIKLVDKYAKLEFWPDEVEPAEHLGWHPASKLPPVDKETGLSDEVIAIQDRFCDGERVIYTRIVGSGWKHDNIKWWCYPPKEE